MPEMNADEGSPFACNLRALRPEERERHVALAAELFHAAEAAQELPDGYGFRLPNDPALLMTAVTFIAKEQLCCPFFGFALELGPEGRAPWLRLTGREGVKPFIQAEIGPLLNKVAARQAGFR